MASNIWKCKCGHIEYGKFPPEECPRCWKIDKFNPLSESEAEDLDEYVLDGIRSEYPSEDGDFGEEEEWP